MTEGYEEIAFRPCETAQTDRANTRQVAFAYEWMAIAIPSYSSGLSRSPNVDPLEKPSSREEGMEVEPFQDFGRIEPLPVLVDAIERMMCSLQR